MQVNQAIIGYNKSNFFCNLTKDWSMTKTHITNCNLTLEEIHKQLYNLRFDEFYQSIGGKDKRSSDFENAKLVPFSLVYYFLLVQHQCIPHPQTVFCEYVLQFCEKNIIGNHLYHLKKEYIEQGYENISFTLDTLAARVCRAYNSFNREVELAFHLMQNIGFNVKYDFKKDYYEGIDLQIKTNDKILNIACYQKSANAMHYKGLKETIRHDNYDANILNMAIDNNNHDTCGNIWLFSKQEKFNLIQKIFQLSY